MPRARARTGQGMTLAGALPVLVPALSAALAARQLLAWAGRRSTAQPVDVRPDLERVLVAAVVARPSPPWTRSHSRPGSCAARPWRCSVGIQVPGEPLNGVRIELSRRG